MLAHRAAKIRLAFAVVAAFGVSACQVATLTQGQFAGALDAAADMVDKDLPALDEIAADSSEIANEDGIAQETPDAADAAMADSADSADASDTADADAGPDGALLSDFVAPTDVEAAVDVVQSTEISDIVPPIEAVEDVAVVQDVAAIADALQPPDSTDVEDTAPLVEVPDVADTANIADIIDAAADVAVIADTPDVPAAPDVADAAAADIDAGCDPAKCPLAPCQQAYCANEACALKPKAGPCYDGNACTLDDLCSNGTCKGGSDSCAEERLDVTVVGGLSLTLGNLGFGRYVTQWTSAVGNSLRFSDSDGSRENVEQTVIAASAKGGWNATRTMAVDGIGNTIAMAWGVGSASCAAGNGSPCTDKLGPISATRYGADGLFAMKNSLQNVQVSFTSPNMQAATVTASATNGAFIPVAFGDGSVGLLMQYTGTYAPTQNNTGTYSPAQQQLFYTLATSPLVPGVAAAVTGVPVDTTFLRDATAVPDGTNRFVLVWVEQAQKVLQSRVFAKNGQPVTNTITLQSAGANIGLPKVVAFDDGSYVATWHMDAGDNTGQGVLARKIKGDFTPLGPAFIVNQVALGDQKNPDIAALPKGGFAIAWTGPDSAGNGVWFRRFTSDTLAVGGDIAVNAVPSGEQSGAAITGMDDGGVVAAFHDAAGGIWTRRFGADGKASPGASERGLAADPAGAQTAPKIAALADITMAVWQGNDLRARLLDPNGNEPAPEFDVSPGGAKTSPAVAAGSGKYAVAWIASGAAPALQVRWFNLIGGVQSGVLTQDGGSGNDASPAIAVAPGNKAMAVVSANDGGALGYSVFGLNGALGKTAFITAKLGSTLNSFPTIARGADGNADGSVLGWQAKGGTDSDGYGVYLARVGDDGAVTPAVAAHINTGGDQRKIAIAIQQNSLLACWESWGIDVASSFGIACRYFTAQDLLPEAGEFVPHLASALDQLQPAVAFVADGTAAVAWSTPNLDGNGLGVQAAYLDGTGKPLAPRIQVNRTRLGDQTLPQIAALPKGQVAFAWQSVNQQSPTDAGGVHWRVVHTP